ncbi:hypothetical protein GCM10029964_083740 [Kibdelosporangium lantanae]
MSARIRLRRLTSVAVAFGVTAALVAVPSHAVAAPAAAPPSTPTALPDENAAAQAAEASGQRVEITSKTTTQNQVFANPDGSQTLEAHAMPVRANTGHGWQPIDTTLAVQPDGAASPAVTTVPVRFSGGGTAPLVELGTEQRLALRWPTPLPQPVLAGDTATYPEVLPGVDLKMTATSGATANGS